MDVSHNTLRTSVTFGEGERLYVAAGATALAVHRHAPVVEQMPAQFDLGGGHGVVRGNNRAWDAFGQLPIPLSGGKDNGD